MAETKIQRKSYTPLWLYKLSQPQEETGGGKDASGDFWWGRKEKEVDLCLGGSPQMSFVIATFLGWNLY